MTTKVSSPIREAKKIELLYFKVSEIDSRASLLKIKVPFIEQELLSIQDSAQANFSHIQTRLAVLEANYKSITPLKGQDTVKYLLEQAAQTENTLGIHSNDIKQLFNKLNTAINKTEKEQKDQHIVR